MKEMFRLGITLSGIYIVAALCLSVVNGITEPVIEERSIAANNEARQLVLSEAAEFTLIEGLTDENVVEVWEGIDLEKTVGYTIKTTPKGYGGEMEVIVGISVDGIITGVNIGSHAETPGLGSKATQPAFKDQFTEKSTSEELNVVKGKVSNDSDIAAISGATITSDAVAEGVNAAIKIYNESLTNK